MRGSFVLPTLGGRGGPEVDRKFAVGVAQRLESAQVKRLGLVSDVANVGAKEVTEGRLIHPAVSKEQLDAVLSTYKDAQRGFFRARNSLPVDGGVKVLMAPTNRVVDYSVSAVGVQVLVNEVIRGDGKKSC